MATKRTIVQIHHDTGYGDQFLDYLNLALRGKDMIAERIVSDPIGESEIAIKSLYAAGCTAFITCESGPSSQPQVVAKFKQIQDAQEYHRALVDCANVARLIDAKTQADSSR